MATNEHYYEFTGTWSWGTWAKSEEEAKEFFKEAYIEDFDIFVDEYQIGQYE